MRSVLTWCLLNLGTSLSHLHPGSGPSEALHRPPPSPHRRPPPPPLPGTLEQSAPGLPLHPTPGPGGRAFLSSRPTSAPTPLIKAPGLMR